MLKRISVFVLIVLVSACKAKKSVTELAANEELAATKVVQEHYKNELNFKTINIRSSARYEDDKNMQSVAADIRMIKDEKIWINVKLLGFPVAKALITPAKVSYYEKVNHTYFEGNFEVLSNWLGTDLDFQKVQNLLLGKALDDLSKTQYVASIEDDLYKLTEKIKSPLTEKEYFFEAANFLVKKEKVVQKAENRSLEIDYPSFGKYNGMFLPNEIFLKAIQDDKVTIEIQYKNITFDEDLSMPFSIPSGYDEVKIN
jgi:hypothetical protein